MRDLLQEVREELWKAVNAGLVSWEEGYIIKERRQKLIERLDTLLKNLEPPVECETEEEKTAFAFGWWKAAENIRENTPKQFTIPLPGKPGGGGTSAQRVWVGLSDRAKLHFVRMHNVMSVLDFIDAIEFELREKNT